MARVASPFARWLLLDLDSYLARGVHTDHWGSARSQRWGELVPVAAGAWQPLDWAAGRDDVFGFVIVAGLLCREVSLRDRYMLELLGPGDVLQLPVLAERPRLGGPVRLTA